MPERKNFIQKRVRATLNDWTPVGDEGDTIRFYLGDHGYIECRVVNGTLDVRSDQQLTVSPVAANVVRMEANP